MSEDNKVLTAAYVPFKTFLNSLDHLKSHGVPNIIDRSVFRSSSGAIQSQIISAFLFFELIDEKGIPSETMIKLVNDDGNRKTNLDAILRKRYRNLFDADLTRLTPSQFEQLFSTEVYGVSGDTRKKAKTFLFQALDFAGVSYSKLLTQRFRSPRKKGGNANGNDGNKDKPSTPEVVTPNVMVEPPSNDVAPIKILTLTESGKQVWIGTNANVLEIRKGRDREFLLALTDLFDDYEDSIKSVETDMEKANGLLDTVNIK